MEDQEDFGNTSLEEKELSQQTVNGESLFDALPEQDRKRYLAEAMDSRRRRCTIQCWANKLKVSVGDVKAWAIVTECLNQTYTPSFTEHMGTGFEEAKLF